MPRTTFSVLVMVLVWCSSDSSVFCVAQRTHRKSHGVHDRTQHVTGISPRLPLAMTLPEQQMLAAYYSNTSFYFEFGCGGSTVLAADLGVKRIVSVDSYMQWVEKVRAATAQRSAAVTVNHVDICKVGFWGFPKDESCKERWPLYAEFIHGVDGIPDLVLVDGRFRVSCFLNSLLKAGPDTIIMIHDFWPRTMDYRAVFAVADVIDGVDSFAVFRRKKDVTDAAIRAMIEVYKYTAV